MKKLYFLLVISVLGLRANAQQEHHYTQFMYNKLLINPAYAGARGVPFATAIYRNQWMGFDGAPKSALVSVNTPFLVNRVGAGLTLSNRKIGLHRDFYGALAYSYDVVDKENISFRIGLMASIKSLSMDFSKAEPLLVGDNSLDTKKVNDFYANVGAGLYLTALNKFYFGISIPNGYGNNLSLQNPNVQKEAREYAHVYTMAGGRFGLAEDIAFMPSILVKYVKNAPVSTDVNLNLDLKEKVTVGLSYRLGGDGPGEAMSLLAMFQVTPMVGVGAAYDFTLSDVKDYSSGSLEAMLQVDLKQKKTDMSNPRFFF